MKLLRDVSKHLDIIMFVHLTDYVSNCNVIGEPKPVTGFDEFSVSENKNKNIEKKARWKIYQCCYLLSPNKLKIMLSTINDVAHHHLSALTTIYFR